MADDKAEPPQGIPGPAEVRPPDEDFTFEEEARGFWHIVKADAWRVIPMILIGIVFMVLGTPAAKFFDFPALAPWGMFGGVAWWTGAMTHGLRRALMPRLDLQALMLEASKSPVGAGLVVVGVCIIISAIFGMVGAFFRT